MANPAKPQIGIIDRIEGDIIVVVVKRTDKLGCAREIYINRSEFNRSDLKVGDNLSIEIKDDTSPSASRPQKG